MGRVHAGSSDGIGGGAMANLQRRVVGPVRIALGRGLAGSPLPFLLLAPLLWSGNFVVARAVHDQIPPISLNFWRWMVALVVLLPLAWPHLESAAPILKRNWRSVLGLALLGVTGFNSILYTALHYTTTTKAALLFAMTPLVIVVMSHVWFRERLRGSQKFGLLLSLPGVALVITAGDLACLGGTINCGDVWVLVSVVFFASYSVLLKRKIPGVAPVAMLAVTTVVGLMCLGPLYLVEIGCGAASTGTAR
jgi:drug/metabolite transporter (DMT)-like permease